MEFFLPIEFNRLSEPISYRDRILLIGSCFTEHIGNALLDYKYNVLQNPNGILFGPDAVSESLKNYVSAKMYSDADLFQLNGVWYSWDHHSRYAATTASQTISLINDSQHAGHEFIKAADWIIITLGSSFTYELTDAASKASKSKGDAVANCHRAPANWFKKRMLAIEETAELIHGAINLVRRKNPEVRFLFTISPVRHVRDGVIENNRSKARLLEAVHTICATTRDCYYFPAYELVIDVLRDYRFYDIDLVHPNYAATTYVMQKFSEHCIESGSLLLMQEVKKIVTARRHKALQPESDAHRRFLMDMFNRTTELQLKHPFLDLKEEIQYFLNS
jgi:hypothetical protein